jgi:hypothetical protein
MTLREPQMPWQEPCESDEDYEDRVDEYHRRWEDYNVACDMAVDAQRDRECERAFSGMRGGDE